MQKHTLRLRERRTRVAVKIRREFHATQVIGESPNAGHVEGGRN